jgi:Alkaline phosphatase PhoX
MRVMQCLLTAAAASSMLACDRELTTPSSPTSTPALAAGFVTSQPAQARALLAQAQLKPIITVGDAIPGATDADAEQRVWAPIPDGLGAYQDGNDLVLFANHEITSGGVDGRFTNARVSRLVLDPATLSVKSGSYAITGKADGFLFQRLCSAAFHGPAEGFEGWFFTGEESITSTSGGMQLAVSQTGAVTQKLPWLGRFSHENYISVPGFGGKTVMIGTDDTSPTGPNTLNSELYMYVADNAEGVLNGSGKLFVFSSTAKDNSGHLETGKPISGKFVEITNPGSLNPGQLQTAVDALPSADKAFKFVRLEDVDYDHRPGVPGQRPAIYFVDTGNNVAICNGTPCDLFGSIYRLEFDPTNPTQNVRLVLLARSRGVAAGDWASPDNIAAGRQSLMVLEDPAYAGFNRAERVWNFKFRNDGSLGQPQGVAELTNQQLTGNLCSDAAGTCWESSGIIDASDWLGEGTWLFDVQAHTLPFSYQDGTSTVNVSREGGQLLYLKLPGS